MLGWNKKPEYQNVHYLLEGISKAPSEDMIIWYSGALTGYMIGKEFPIKEEIRVKYLREALALARKTELMEAQ